MENQIFEPQSCFTDALEIHTDLSSTHVFEPSTQYVVKDFLLPGQIVQIKALGCGTFIACENACAIAEGRTVLTQFESHAPAGVMILQGGVSHEHFTGRLNRLMSGTEPPAIKVISPVHFTGDATKNLCDETVQDEFFTWLSKNKAYRVLILDGIEGFLPDKPEPSQVNRLLAGLRRESITVISIESNGRGGLPLFPNQPDLILNVKALEGGEDLIIRIDFEKARSLKRDQQKTFFMKLEELDGGKFAFVEAPMDEFLKARTLQLLLNGWKQKKIAQETGKDQSTISRWKDKLVADSLVGEDGKKYVPTEAGKKLLREHNLMDF